MGAMDFPCHGRLCECPKCHRKILVEEWINGVSHTVGMAAVCWDCLDDSEKSKAQELHGIAA
jgi:hypothetical protein